MKYKCHRPYHLVHYQVHYLVFTVHSFTMLMQSLPADTVLYYKYIRFFCCSMYHICNLDGTGHYDQALRIQNIKAKKIIHVYLIRSEYFEFLCVSFFKTTHTNIWLPLSDILMQVGCMLYTSVKLKVSTWMSHTISTQAKRRELLRKLLK